MQQNSRKTSTSASLATLGLCGSQQTRQEKILQEMAIPDHLTCLLRNLHAGQEATVKTRHGTIHWLQIGKGVRQCCMLSPCLFKLYITKTVNF